jgi:hypothetical protein
LTGGRNFFAKDTEGKAGMTSAMDAKKSEGRRCGCGICVELTTFGVEKSFGVPVFGPRGESVGGHVDVKLFEGR